MHSNSGAKAVIIVLALVAALAAIDYAGNQGSNAITGYQIVEEIDYSIPGFVLERGWNLIGITDDMAGKTTNDIKGQCDIRYAFAYDDAAELHLMATPTRAAPIVKELEGNAMWVYAANKCRYNPTATPENVAKGKRSTFNGINTTIITRDMNRKKIKDLPGCGNKIEKAWVYQPSGASEEQDEAESYVGWTRLLPNDKIADAYTGRGMVVKTTGKCILFPNYPATETGNSEQGDGEEKFYSDFPISPPKKVVLVVDSDTYGSLMEEINRFANDISSDMDTNVKVLSNSFVSPEDVKEALLSEKASDGDFDGVIFIGNIPFQYAHTKGSVLGGPAPSDAWYLDLEGRNQYNPGAGHYEDCGNGNMCTVASGGVSYVEIDAGDGLKSVPRWSGRIFPPLGRPDRLGLLKKYFDRNHDYRLGKISYEGALVYGPDNSLTVCTDYNECFSNVKTSLVDSGIASEDKITAIVALTQQESTKGTYLAKQRELHRFEQMTAHGEPTGFYAGNGEKLSYSDFVKNPPGALFSSFASCSVGAFHATNNLASAYVFEGNGLAAYASTTPILAGNIFARRALSGSSYAILGSGGRLYEAFGFRANHYFHILGDPTLRINEPAGGCVLAFNTLSLDFGNIDLAKIAKIDRVMQKAVKIKNQGSEDCSIKSISYDPESQLEGFGSGGININELPYTLKPGEVVEMTVIISPPDSAKGYIAMPLKFVTNGLQYIKELPLTITVE